MIHFKIISACDLPSSKKNKYCSSYVIVYPQNFDFPANDYYAQTKTIKKTPNPEWNQEFIIPFVMCNSIRLEFWESLTFNDKIIGSANIYFQVETFYQNPNNAPQISSITLANPSSDCHPTFKYSISSSLSSIDVKPAKRTERIYAYLTYEPPLRPQEEEEVQLNVYGVNENGTIVDPISDLYTRGENEPTHCGPSGPTRVFYFLSSITTNTTYPVYEQYFFYAKNIGYSGRVTLNFVTVPYSINSMKVIKECRVFNNQWTIYVNNKNTNNHSYSVFPIKLHFNNVKGIISPISIPEQIIHQSVPNQPISDENNNNSNLFDASYNYYHNDLDGIAIKKIKDSIGQVLCPSNKILHDRFEIIPGNHYSLIGAFDYNNINEHPSYIKIGLGWDTMTDLDASILQFCDDGKQITPVCYHNHSNENESIQTTGDNITGDGRGDDEKIYLKLNEIPQNIKYLGIVITSYRSVPFNEINGAFCRVVDEVSKKEVMYMNLSKKEKKTGLLFAVMTRLDGVWDMWPCLEYFDGTVPSDAQLYFDQFMKSGIVDKMLKI